MSKIFSWFSGIQLNRMLIIGAVSILMLFSTACSRAVATDRTGLKNADPSSPNPPGQVQPYKGGMNNFDDVDTTRFDKGSVDAKAKALRDRVERNINEKGIDSPEQYVKNYRSGTPLNKRIENIGDDLGEAADEAKEGVKQFGKTGSKNLERNVKGASEDASRNLEQVKQNVKAAAESAQDQVDAAADAVSRRAVD